MADLVCKQLIVVQCHLEAFGLLLQHLDPSKLRMSASAAEVRLSSYQVGASLLSSLYYIPDYVTELEEKRIIGEVHASQAKWVQLSGRRLQNHGGIVHTKGLIPAPMPRWLEQLSLRVHNHLLLFGDQPPNHVLINSYQPGCGIMPHQDGPLYHPVVCILSLGSPAVLRFWRKQPDGTGKLPSVASILVMPRSLLVFADEAYDDCLHGIDEVLQETIDASVVNAEVLQEQAGQQQLHPQQNEHHDISQEQGLLQDEVQQQQELHDKLARRQQQPASIVPKQACGPPSQRASCHCKYSNSSGTGGLRTVVRTGERVSLTIRRVLKVHKALGLSKK